MGGDQTNSVEDTDCCYLTQLRSAVRLYSSAVHRYSFIVSTLIVTWCCRVVVGFAEFQSEFDILHGSVGSGNSLAPGFCLDCCRS